MANRAAPLTFIETLSGNIPASTYFDQNINPAFTALNDATLGYCNGIATDTGSANNYVVAPVFGSTSTPNAGMLIVFIPANTNTGASTLTFGTLTAQSIFDWAGNALLPGAIRAGRVAVVIYISGAFRLIASSAPNMLFYNTPVPAGGGTISIDCGGYSQISLVIDGTQQVGLQTWTINVQNVMWGAHFDVMILTSSSNQHWKWSGTDQAGNTITPIQAWYGNAPGGGGQINFTAVNLISSFDQAPSFIGYTGMLAFKSSVSQQTLLRFNTFYN